MQCHYAADPRVAGSNPGKVNQVNRVSSSVVSAGASHWCAITYVLSNSMIRSVRSSLKPGGVSCLKVVPSPFPFLSEPQDCSTDSTQKGFWKLMN